MGQIRLSAPMPSMSAKGSKADIWEGAGEVAEVPGTDLALNSDAQLFDHHSGRPALRRPSRRCSRSAGNA
jgi:hypothetical protein